MGRVNNIKQQLDKNLSIYCELIDALRDYYSIENLNPSGLIYANSTGTYAATAKHNFATFKTHET